MASLRPSDYDTAMREAEVIGNGPRIEPLDNDALDADARQLVDTIRISAGAGPAAIVPEYMRTMIRHPAIFRCQMELGNVLFRGLIPQREREIAVLRIGWLCGAPYEFGQHVNIAKRVGLTTEDVERAIAGSGAPGWSRHESAILRGVEELLADQSICDETWAVLAESWDEPLLIEYTVMVGQYVATAYVQNALRVRMTEDNPGLANR